MKKLRAAIRMNNTQQGAVVMLTVLNLGAWVSRDDHPLWLLIFCLLFWPLIAFIANLVLNK